MPPQTDQLSVLNGGATSGDVIEGVALKHLMKPLQVLEFILVGSNLYTGKYFKLCGTGNTFALEVAL